MDVHAQSQAELAEGDVFGLCEVYSAGEREGNAACRFLQAHGALVEDVQEVGIAVFVELEFFAVRLDEVPQQAIAAGHHFEEG